LGLSMEFYAGEPVEIGHAFTACDLDGLRDGTIAHSYADLSLHLSPDHLDLLSEEVAASTETAPVRLFGCIEDHVGGLDGESSADVVAHAWVHAIAAAPDESLQAITRRWMVAVARDVGDASVEAGPDTERAVAALVRLCREAVRRGSRVVFAWYL
jgi:hypothetical protein